eukprot:TRINITY_DN26241_c0_g2_i1.p1 TRINITY_DN26241_c0_g2~~TRINITY_DN26241_c0_g2_i1.p1  ORF type:complete len:167 (-),score=18.57 TRINITY_DN26241_c0_g2_i1:273-773(-)
MDGSMNEVRGDGVMKLLGCEVGSQEITDFLKQIGVQETGNPPPAPEIKAYPALQRRAACEYHNYKTLGISFCFENSLLRAIHVYNSADGYSTYKGPLPHSIRLDMEGHELVRVLGEPDGKFGGGRGRGPISLAYKEKGLQIDFVGSDWEDRQNVISCITVHEPVDN